MKQPRMLFSGLIFMVIGCVDIEGPVPLPVEAHDVFSNFYFTTNATLINPGDTLQLSLGAVASDGSAIPVDPRKVQWRSDDSIRLYVDTLGRIVAKEPITNSVMVTARYTHGSTTRTASMTVYVTGEEMAASSLKVVALDSTRIGAGFGASLPRIRLDLYEGTTLVRAGAQLPVTIPTPYFASYVATGGPNQEPVYAIGNGGSGIGKFWVTVSVNLYGSEIRDSVEFTGIYPFKVGEIAIVENSSGEISVNGGQTNLRLMQQPCAVVRVFNFTRKPLDVVFSDSSSASDSCGPIPQSVRQALSYPGFPLTESVGGNLLNMPSFSVGFRRSGTHGAITWFLRNATTKDRLPFSGSYQSIHVE